MKKVKKKRSKSFFLLQEQVGEKSQPEQEASKKSFKNKKRTIARLGPVALALLTYLNSLTCGFTYDDRRAILENRNVAGSAGWWQLLEDDFWGTPMANPGSHKSYRPLVTLTFKLQALVFGLDSAFVFHLLNLVLHLFVVDRVFQVTRFIQTKVVQRERQEDSTIPCLTALLFACHPVHVEAVTSLVGRAELMGALFVLLSFQSFGNQLVAPRQGGPTAGLLELAKPALFATLALLSKENCGASTIVMNLLLLAWFSLVKRRPVRLGGALVMIGLLGAVTTARLRLGDHPATSNVILPKFSHSDNPLAQETRQFCLRQAELLQLDPQQLDSVCSNNKMLSKIGRWMLLTRLYLPMFSLKLMVFPTELSYDWPLASIGLIKSPLETRFLVAALVYLATGLFVVRWMGAKIGHLRLLKQTHKRPQSSSEDDESDEGSETSSVRSIDTIRSEDSGFVDASPRVEFQAAESLEKRKPPEEAEKKLDDQVGWALAWLVAPYAPASNLLVPVGFLVAERALYLPSFGLCLLIAISLDQLASASRLSLQFKGSLKTVLVGIGSEKRSADTTAKFALVLPLLILLGLRSWHRNADWRNEISLYSSNLAQSAGKSLANLASLSSEPSSALRLYRAALLVEPRSAELHYNLALLLQSPLGATSGGPTTAQEGEEDPVEYHYKLALKLRKNFPLAALNLAAHQYEARGQLAKAWRTAEQCASLEQMSPSETDDFHRHVRIQIECLISGAKLRLPALELAHNWASSNKQIAPAKQNEFANCQLALQWLAEAQRRANQLVVNKRHSDAIGDDRLGDLSKQMATVHWLRAQCVSGGQERARALGLASQLALASRAPIPAQLYADHAAQLAPEAGRRLLERALATERTKRGAQSGQLARLGAALARLPGLTAAEAWQQAERALSLAPPEPSLLSLAARLAYEAGELQQSEHLHGLLVQALEQARSIEINSEPSSSQRAAGIEQQRKQLGSALANYGAILQVNGRVRAARQLYRRALQADPSNSAALANLRSVGTNTE